MLGVLRNIRKACMAGVELVRGRKVRKELKSENKPEPDQVRSP